MGTDDWDEMRCKPVAEERLLEAVKRRLGPQVVKLQIQAAIKQFKIIY